MIPPMTNQLHPPSPADRAATFAALHRAGTFVIPNPWDAGSARLLEHLGFPALATTSAGLAFSRGEPDGTTPRARVFEHLAALVAATRVPVSADLGCGFGDAPEDVVAAIRDAAAAGVAGASIEDVGRDVYPLGQAVDRVRAAVEAVRALPRPIVLTARADNLFVGRDDLPDTIRRLQAFQDAGADVLFAPGLRRLEDVRTVLGAVDRPLNVLAGLPGSDFGIADLREAGVRRVSVGGSLARAAYDALLRAARELAGGTLGYSQGIVTHRELNALFSDAAPKE
jgi:2-methylisocitrate lyase-like PEP mutase family enzyme